MLRTPNMVPLFSGRYDAEGKPIVKLLNWGSRIEEDPERPGYARWAHKQGSVCRPGKGYIALGLADDISPVVVPAQVGIVPGVTADLDFAPAIREPGFLGYHIIQGVPAAATLAMGDMRYRNDGLMSGNVPLGIFTPGSFYNPILGHFVSERTSLTVRYRNFALLDQTIIPGFILL